MHSVGKVKIGENYSELILFPELSTVHILRRYRETEDALVTEQDAGSASLWLQFSSCWLDNWSLAREMGLKISC